MENIIYSIANEFTKTPGPRGKKEGKKSGEEFLEKVLLPKFREAISKKIKLVIDLDGTYGYPPSFLDESFGGLVKETGKTKKEIFETLEIQTIRKQYKEIIENRMIEWEKLHLVSNTKNE